MVWLTGHIQIELNTTHIDCLYVHIVAIDSPLDQSFGEIGADSYEGSIITVFDWLVGALEGVKWVLAYRVIVHQLEEIFTIFLLYFSIKYRHRYIVGVATQT